MYAVVSHFHLIGRFPEGVLMGGQEWTGNCWLWGKRKVGSHEGGSQKAWAPFEGHPG